MHDRPARSCACPGWHSLAAPPFVHTKSLKFRQQATELNVTFHCFSAGTTNKEKSHKERLSFLFFVETDHWMGGGGEEEDDEVGCGG